MGYQKLQAGYLFTGKEILQNGEVLITDQLGTVVDIVPASEAGDDIRRLEGMVSPGFINCHCHLELSHMKGLIPKHLGMTGFLRTVVQKRGFAMELIQEAIRKGEEEMLENGIVAVGDISNTTDTIPVKSGGRLHYFNFIEALGFNEDRAEATMDYCRKIRDEFEQHTGFNSVIVPHAPYTISKRLFELIETESIGKTISIHNQESWPEEEFMIAGTGGFRDLFLDLKMDISDYSGRGKNSLLFSYPYLDSSLRTLLIHNVTTSKQDLDQLDPSVLKNFYWCLCVNANLYINRLLPPIDLFRENNCNLVLGTDSLASNDTLSILDEIKTIVQAYPFIPMSEILSWATINGAVALNAEDLLGSFEKGRKPGVVQLEGLADGMITAGTTIRRII